MRYHLTTHGIVKVKKTDNFTKTGEDVKQQELSHPAGGSKGRISSPEYGLSESEHAFTL